LPNNPIEAKTVALRHSSRHIEANQVQPLIDDQSEGTSSSKQLLQRIQSIRNDLNNMAE